MASHVAWSVKTASNKLWLAVNSDETQGDYAGFLEEGDTDPERLYTVGLEQDTGDRWCITTTVPAKAQTFDVEAYEQALDGATYMGKTLLHSELVPTTQTTLHEALPFRAGTAFVADLQAQGRGRGDNTWESPHGCLMTSFQFEVYEAAQLTFIQYLVALVMVESIRELHPDIPVFLKWPNDIYMVDPDTGADADAEVWASGVVPTQDNTLKIGGVIFESASSQGVFQITCGMGVNITNVHPTTAIDAWVQQHNALSWEKPLPAPSREATLGVFMSRFEEALAQFQDRGFAPFKDRYLSLWLHTNQMVRISTSINPLRITGLTDTGFLSAVDDKTGHSHELMPDGNRLDFFNGLISTRVVPPHAK